MPGPVARTPGEKQKHSLVIFKQKTDIKPQIQLSMTEERSSAQLNSSVSPLRHTDDLHAISFTDRVAKPESNGFSQMLQKTINMYYVPLLLSINIRVMFSAYRTNRQKMKIGVFLILLSEKFLFVSIHK